MDNRQFSPDVVLERGQQADLASTAATPGYKVLHQILRSEVDRFVLSLINEDAGDDAAVLAKHKLAKAAAQFYAGVTARINEEILQYTAAPRANDKPVDVTEGLLDIGAMASRLEDLDEEELGEGSEWLNR